MKKKKNIKSIKKKKTKIKHCMTVAVYGFVKVKCNDEGFFKIISEIRRVMKKEGKGYATFPYFIFVIYQCSFLLTWFKVKIIVTFFSSTTRGLGFT